MNVKKVLVLTSITAFSIALGGFLGYFLGSIFNTSHAEGDEYVTPVMDDIKVTREKLNTFLAGKNISDVDLTSSSLTASDLVNIALDNVSTNHDKAFLISKGLVVAKNSAVGRVDQNIFAGYMKEGDKYFVESMASSSFVKNGTRFYLNTKTSDNTTIYRAKSGSVNAIQNSSGDIIAINGSYDESCILKRADLSTDLANGTDTNYTQEEIVKYFGRATYLPCVYQISNDSVIYNQAVTVEDSYSGNETGTTGIKRESDGSYTITLILNPLKAIINYATQMNSENKMVYPPQYNQVLMEFKTTASLEMISRRTHEFYDVFPAQTNGGDAPTVGNLMDYFFFDEKVTGSIPTLSEQFNYQYLEEVK
jgi:hypothetical protein